MSASDAASGLTAARLARLAYETDPGRLERGVAGAGLDICAWWSVEGAQAIACHEPARGLDWIAPRGTDGEPADLRDDLRCLMVEDRRCRVHAGFADAAARLWRDIRPWLAGRDRARPLAIAGHSLGAAIALLLARELVHAGEARRVAAVWTFGSPRVGDRDFVRQLDRVPVYRVVNCLDLVCCLPPPVSRRRPWLRGYRHVGDVRYVDRAGEIHRSPGLVAMGVDQALAVVDHWRKGDGVLQGLRSLADHRMERYEAAMKRAAGV